MMKLLSWMAILATVSNVCCIQGNGFPGTTLKLFPQLEPKFTYGDFRPIDYNPKRYFINLGSDKFPQNVPVITADRRQIVLTTPPPQQAPTVPPISPTKLENILEQEWEAFKLKFNKTYSGKEEDRQRKEVFIENRSKISKFNKDYGNGKYSFVQKINGYADLLNHEFNKLINGFNKTNIDGKIPERKATTFLSTANVKLPTSVDWREAGAVTSVRSQGDCGACYAFAAAGAIEGHNFRKTNVLVELSPQNLIDCTSSYANSGCAGGLMEYAFEYIKENKGIDPEFVYPFEGRDGQKCKYRDDECSVQVTGYVILNEGDEKDLEDVVGTLGPVAVGIDAHSDSFQFYSDGVYFEQQCSSQLEQLNHAMLVVGYGTEPNGQQYWLLKNSYGPEWGLGGYMKLARNSSNHCGVASYAIYPLV